MSCFIAYLPLQHQLFGEQHGLITEGFDHLHAPRHIPGTAWTFNTWPKTRKLHELKDTTATNQKHIIHQKRAGKMSGCVAEILWVLTYST